MLFSKKITPSCSYCKRGNIVSPETILCQRKGVTSGELSCRGFRYDPLKRVPPRPVLPDFRRFDDADFTL